MASSPVPGEGRAPAIWVGVVVVALFAATALMGRPPAFPASGAAAWLPPDATRVRYAGPGGTISVEWALDQAVSLLGSGPPAFLRWLGEATVDWETASVARVVSVSASPTGDVLGREDDLLTVAADGVRTEVEAPSAGATRIYVPGRLDLPAAMAAGSGWSSAGTVVETTAAGSERLDYSADYDARTPDDPALVPRGCVVVTMRVRIGTLPTDTSERTWCRHAGVLSFRTADGDWQPDTAPAAQAEPISPPGVALDWSRAGELRFASRTVSTVGVNAPQVAPVSAPALLPDGTIVFNSQVVQDVIAVDATAEPPTIRWSARPGGRNTATATFGTITVATGSGRQLVAYGPSGRWLWQQHLSDVAIVTPVRLGDLVVVPTLDGRVTAYDLATGAERWSWTSSAEIRVAPVATADRVVVIDQAGQLTCLDPDGNEVWTVEAKPVERFTIWAPTGAHDPVVVLPEAGGARVQARSLADGTRRWRVRELTVAKDVIALDHLVLLRDDDRTAALDPLTGERRWTWNGARTLTGIGGGDRALLLTRTSLLLLDDQGSQVKEWPLPVPVSVGTPYLVASGQRVLAYVGSDLELGTLP